jgi:hypothetical protein
MNNFDSYCNLILEVYGKRVDVPYDGRTAPNRYNNPGGAYPKKGFEKYGMEGYGIIGGGHPIAKYPTVAHGIAANIAHLKSMPIVGKTVGQARHYWVKGNFNGSISLSGMNSNQVITKEMLNDPQWLAQWMRGTAKDEGFGKPIDDSTIAQATNILQGSGSIENTLPPETKNNETMVASNTEVNNSPPEVAQQPQNQSDQENTDSENSTIAGKDDKDKESWFDPKLLSMTKDIIKGKLDPAALHSVASNAVKGGLALFNAGKKS